MKVKTSRLKEIVREEIDAVLLELDKHGKMSKSERERALPWEVFPGWSGKGDLKTLAAGIAEEEEMDEACQGNPYHDDQGRWTNPEKAKGSYSKRDKACKGAGQRRRPSASSRSVAIPPSKKPCGRDADWKCKDQTPRWSEQLISDADGQTTVSGVDQAVLRGIIQQELARAMNKKPSACTVDYCARMVNYIVASSKGEAHEKDK